MFRELNRLIRPYNAKIKKASDIKIDEVLHTYQVTVMYNGNRYCITGVLGILDGTIYSTDVYVNTRNEELLNMCDEVIRFFADER